MKQGGQEGPKNLGQNETLLRSPGGLTGLTLTLAAALACAIGVAPVWASKLSRPDPGKAIQAEASRFPRRIRVEIAESSDVLKVRGLDVRIYRAKGKSGSDSGSSDRRLASDHRELSADGRVLAADTRERTEWAVTCRSGQVVLRSPGRRLEVRGGVSLESPSGFLMLSGLRYRETLWIYADDHGSGCQVVNEVDLEQYLDGLVNSEFSAGWNAESVKAQVIAARTYALYQMRQARLRGARFDVHSTVKDQVYGGAEREHFRASRSVDETRGLVLVARAGGSLEPIKAFYHSSCGGLTELPEHVWGSRLPGFRSRVHCPFCATSPRFRWKLELTEADLTEALKRGLRRDSGSGHWPARAKELIRGARLVGVIAPRSSDEDRVETVDTIWALPRERLEIPVPAAQFRDWVGAARLKSTSFTAELASGQWRFEGRGNGHGVGMCQWGAKAMGDQGKKLTQILQFYYPDATLKKMW